MRSISISTSDFGTSTRGRVDQRLHDLVLDPGADTPLHFALEILPNLAPHGIQIAIRHPQRFREFGIDRRQPGLRNLL